TFPEGVIEPPFAVVLNGASSSGKSAIADALQRTLAGVWFRVGVDDLLKMLPLEERQDELLAELPTAMRGVHSAMAAIARAGNRVIIDHVLIPAFREQLVDELGGIPTLWVKVDCPLAVLEEREATRGNRELGLARKQFDSVHRDVSYDVEVDTSLLSVDEAVHRIVDALEVR